MKIKVGIIAEDHSDIDTLKVLIRRLSDIRFKIKGHATEGCAKLRRKCSAIVKNWYAQGITYFIICHDLDSDNQKELAKLKKDLCKKVETIPNCKNVVCIVIPIQELEAWFLADISVLQKQFKGIKLKEINHPERIRSPKEYIKKASCKQKWKPLYSNTTHNKELAQDLDLKKVQARCPAFLPFHDFVLSLGTC